MQPSTSKLLFSVQVRNEWKSLPDGFSDFMENCCSQNVLVNGVIQSRHLPQPSPSHWTAAWIYTSQLLTERGWKAPSVGSLFKSLKQELSPRPPGLRREAAAPSMAQRESSCTHQRAPALPSPQPPAATQAQGATRKPPCRPEARQGLRKPRSR